MTVSSTPRRAGPYAINGVTTAFPFSFKVFEKSDVGVVLTLADGSYSFLTLDSDYSLTLNTDQDNSPGGTVTYTGSGSTLTMLGTLPVEQDTDITNVGRFLPQVLEDALDRAVILIQQQQEVSDRTLQAAPGTAVKLAFPAPSSGKFIRWRADLTGLENAESSENPGLQGLLLDTSSALRNAGMVGYDPQLPYTAGTVGAGVTLPAPAGGRPLSPAIALGLRSVMPDQFGDVGFGGDDTLAFQKAFATGRNVDVDDGKTYHLSSELPVNISTLVGKNYKSQQLNFNGAQIVVNGGGNFIKGVGWPFTTGTKVILNGGGARITSTTPQTGNGIFLQECVGWQVKDFDIRSFQSAVHLYVNDPTHWCEGTLISDTWARASTYGFRTSIAAGGTSSSFDQTRFENCYANCTTTGASGFNLTGFHGRTSLSNCGVFLNEEGATGTVGFVFNGNFSNAVAQIWGDGGVTADNFIQFGAAYPVLDEVTSSMGGALTVQMAGTVGDIANYCPLPPGWGHRLKVVECTTVYGSHLYSDFVASSKRSASQGEFLHFSGQFFMARGAANTLYKITVALPVGTTRVQHALICPYANGVDNIAKSAGQCGVFSLDAAVNPTVITLFAIPTNANGTGGTEGCNYMFNILCKMA